MKTTNKKRAPEDVYKLINRKYVQIKSGDKKRNNEIRDAVLGKLLEMMSTCSDLFANMKPRIAGLGSYYDGLRVGHPSEYDMNVILRIPMNYKNIKLDAKDTNYDYTNIVMPSEFRRLSKTPATANKGFIDTQMWCDNRYRLSVVKFRSWMQGVVDAALATLPERNGLKVLTVNNKCYYLSAKMSGPANTITIYIDRNKNDIIDVDLVPTFDFTISTKIPVGSKVNFEKVRRTKVEQYFVVPKPTNDGDYNWRLTFPFQERMLIKDKYNLKSTAKLMKLLRDVQEFKGLVSYFIKTLFLWERSVQNDEFWVRNSVSHLVLHMIGRLRDCLKKQEIKNFWCPESNLIKGKIGKETCENWCNRLTVIINDIEKNSKQNPDVILKYFTKKQESEQVIQG